MTAFEFLLAQYAIVAGLGVSLLGLTYVYQRFVFRVAPEEEA